MFRKGKFKVAAALLLCAIMLAATPELAVRSLADTTGTDNTGSSSTSGKTEEEKKKEEEEAKKKQEAQDAKDKLDELNAAYDKLKNEQAAIQNDINKAKNDKEKQLAIKNQLDNKIGLTREQIAVLTERIKLLEEEIVQQEEYIVDKEEEINVNYDLFKKRMRAMYMTNDTTVLSIILSTDSFSDMLSRAEMSKRVATRDNELIEQLINDKIELEQQKQELDEAKEGVEADKEELAALKATLDGQLTQTVSNIQDITKLENEFKEDLAAVQQKSKQLQAEIDAAYKTIADSTGEYVGGQMQWPLPGYTGISSNYGWRFNNTDFHTGVDITGSSVYGKSVVSANAGTVVLVNYSYVQGVGYGKYIIVDHGGGYTTLYAHLSEIVVSVGDTVSRGQTIGKVGSTGWSTGPHLHFEVRINKQHTNPLPYLRG